MKNMTIYQDSWQHRAAGSISPAVRPETVARRTSIAAALMLLAAVAVDSDALAANFPAGLSAEGKTQLLTVHAEGVQIYECKADPVGGLKWQFREPLATLLKDGKTVGRHFAGPSWELVSGSAVVGKVEAQAPGATPSDIAVLELSVIKRRGTGELEKTTTIQRLDTKGGVFSGSCNMPGMFHLEPYTAEYVFLSD
ncbi:MULTISPECIES: DUF3455 domain-containing protein [unclassified Phyllobacterium]|uniref:DUF3455 domain-containing protein n=1 Tax=unclassified Phyllobacterium TaxID=2638441 RepID=UPI003012B1DF